MLRLDKILNRNQFEQVGLKIRNSVRKLRIMSLQSPRYRR